EARERALEGGLPGGKVRFLRQIRNARAAPGAHFAAVRIADPGQDLAEGALSCPIVPHESDFLSSDNGECRVLEQYATREGFLEPDSVQNRHAGASYHGRFALTLRATRLIVSSMKSLRSGLMARC